MLILNELIKLNRYSDFIYIHSRITLYFIRLGIGTIENLRLDSCERHHHIHSHKRTSKTKNNRTDSIQKKILFCFCIIIAIMP